MWVSLVIKIYIILFLFSKCHLCQDYAQISNAVEKQWSDFKEKFNKTYVGHHEIFKKKAYLSNLEKIMRHNEEASNGKHSYFLKDHELADMTSNTYLTKMVKLTHSRHRKLDAQPLTTDFSQKFEKLPEEVNWVEKGFKTPVYNQKDCGSCYAFSIAGVLQGQVFKQTDKLLPLSSQQIVDCSATSGNYGCGGGSLRNTLRYLEKVGGIMAYSDYPYLAKQGKCHYDKHMAIANVSSWAVLPARDEKALQVAVATIGPVAVSINAAPRTFQLYHKGIYDDPICTSNKVNHAMLVVGYTKDAWILKNWWGKHWGEQGYMRLQRNVNKCGVANYAAYALV